MQNLLGVILLSLGLLYGAVVLFRAYRDRVAFRQEKGNFLFIGVAEAIVYVIATLGVSDFLMNTLWIRHFSVTEDKKLPATLIACGLVPGAVIAFFLLGAQNSVEMKTLIPCAAGIASGCIAGTKLVAGMDGTKIRKVMGIALIGSLIALLVRIAISGGEPGTATGLTTPQLVFATAFSFFWGVVNMIGVPMKPAGTAMFLLFGMSPLATLACVLVMGCFGPMSGAIPILKNGGYHQKTACAAVIFGALGAACGSIFAISINQTLLNILVLCVMVIAIVSLLRN